MFYLCLMAALLVALACCWAYDARAAAPQTTPLLGCTLLWSSPQVAAVDAPDRTAEEALQTASAVLLRQVNKRILDRAHLWQTQQVSSSSGAAASTQRQELLDVPAPPCQVTLRLARSGSFSPQSVAAFPHLWAHDESFSITSSLLEGEDERRAPVRCINLSAVSLPGLMRSVGGFLRLLAFDQGEPSLPASAFQARSQPVLLSAEHPFQSSAYIRGVQLSYRDTSNSFDTWSVEQMQEYLEDLAVFGCNTVEVVAPDGNADPHFTLDPPAMNAAISEMAAKMGMNVSMWYPYQPGMEPPFGTWWESLPILNSLFVPGGDGSSGTLQQLISALDAAMDQLQAQHPGCQVWISTQEWNQTELDQFYGLLWADPPPWLTGVVYGPHTRVTLEATRAAVPPSFPIRHYPDICHQLKAEFPQPSWVRASKYSKSSLLLNIDLVILNLH